MMLRIIHGKLKSETWDSFERAYKDVMAKAGKIPGLRGRWLAHAGAYSGAAANMPAITAMKTTATPKRSPEDNKASILAPTTVQNRDQSGSQKWNPYSRSINDQPSWSSRPSSNRHFSRATNSDFVSGCVTTSAGRGGSMARL
jgi:hypothetical protein